MAKTGTFSPIIHIPEDERTPVDLQAVRIVNHIYEEVRSTMDTERSRQQKIGISEYGAECRRCVARKLSLQYVKINDPSWKAQMGTFGHAGMDEHFTEKYVALQAPDAIATDEKPLYYAERRVEVMSYKGLELGGSCDLYIQGATYGIVVDWKFQGDYSLKKSAKGQISRAYTVQMHTYGFGYELLGLPVTHVLLYALPRDGELWEAKPNLMRYDRQLVIDELADIQRMIDTAEIVGWQKLIDAQPRAGYCPDCDAYERHERDEPFAWLDAG